MTGEVGLVIQVCDAVYDCIAKLQCSFSELSVNPLTKYIGDALDWGEPLMEHSESTLLVFIGSLI